MNCEIIAIGSELLTPHRSDTNSLFLTERLNKLGVQVAFKSIVGDRKQDLVDQVRIALSRADIVITMGGLGPTVDDLTREAVAEALGFKLKRDQAIVGALYARFAARRMQHDREQLPPGRRHRRRNHPRKPQRHRARPIPRHRL